MRRGASSCCPGVTLGLFINPGVVPPARKGQEPRRNRSFEYDTLSDQYARFLEKEILPEVGKRYNLRQDAAGRAICGISSGGICAFTVAWQRPDLFSKVLSHVGSFTNIRGGDAYPGPIRVFLQDGSNDLDNLFGSWPLANQQMAAAPSCPSRCAGFGASGTAKDRGKRPAPAGGPAFAPA